jgi:hypothetical protein
MGTGQYASTIKRKALKGEGWTSLDELLRAGYLHVRPKVKPPVQVRFRLVF